MSIFKVKSIALCASLLFTMALYPVYAGYSMNPLVTMLDLSKNPNASAEVVIKSEPSGPNIPIAIELKIKGREIGTDGTTVKHHDDNSADNFIVYPSQIVLMPGESQRVQIKWAGETLPKKEIAFGLIAEQAPVKLGDEDAARNKAEGRLYVLVKYDGAIVVTPAGAKSFTVIDSAVAGKDTQGKDCLILSIHNSGTGRQKLAGMSLQITPIDKSGKTNFKSTLSYKPVLNSNQTKQSLFPGYHRRIEVPWPAGIPVGPIHTVIKFE